ncbi:MAG: hypothetical protein ACREK2_05315 [Gemmatimonadota bacterium]
MHIDHSVYPDVDDPPDTLDTPSDKADYVHRICSAWDYGIVPDRETFRLFRGWRDIFDRYPLAISPAYHAFRSWFGWPAVEKVGILDTYAERLDRRENRGDPCRDMM